MAPPKYKDLGKAAKDILNEDFKFEQSFELKSKLNGVDLKSTFSDKGKGLAGNMEVFFVRFLLWRSKVRHASLSRVCV